MIVTTQLCARCGSDQVRKNGSSSGRAKYQCKECSYQGYLHPAGPARAARYAQVENLLVERNSQRSIVRHERFAHERGQVGKKSAAAPAALVTLAAEKGPTQGVGGARTR